MSDDDKSNVISIASRRSVPKPGLNGNPAVDESRSIVIDYLSNGFVRFSVVGISDAEMTEATLRKLSYALARGAIAFEDTADS